MGGRMDHNAKSRTTDHFHIRWPGVARLDWEPFRTRQEAEARAKELARPGELYVIEEFREECTRCGSKAASAS